MLLANWPYNREARLVEMSGMAKSDVRRADAHCTDEQEPPLLKQLLAKRERIGETRA